jgi:hypothetical protein
MQRTIQDDRLADFVSPCDHLFACPAIFFGSECLNHATAVKADYVFFRRNLDGNSTNLVQTRIAEWMLMYFSYARLLRD